VRELGIGEVEDLVEKISGALLWGEPLENEQERRRQR
jgi:hypothetical protein